MSGRPIQAAKEGHREEVASKLRTEAAEDFDGLTGVRGLEELA